MMFALLPLLFALVAIQTLAAPHDLDLQERQLVSNSTTTKTKMRCNRRSTSAISISTSRSSSTSSKAVSQSVIGGVNAVTSASSVRSTSSVRPSSSSVRPPSSSVRPSTSTVRSTSSVRPSSSSVKPSSSSVKASSSSTSATSTATASTPTDSTAATLLQLHNDFRKQYGANALVWDDTVAAYAKEQASKCVFAHSSGPYGENLAAGVGGGYTAASGFQGWAAEASSYNYDDPKFSSATGHFTQVVWKSTTKLGCAVVSCPNGSIFDAKYNAANILVWCNYEAPGNYQGQFATQVGRKV